jgi:hypothetical protein
MEQREGEKRGGMFVPWLYVVESQLWSWDSACRRGRGRGVSVALVADMEPGRGIGAEGL